MMALSRVYRLCPCRRLLALAAATLLLTSCSWVTHSSESHEPLRLYLQLEQPSYRPGEAFIVNVLLLNIQGDAIPATWLNHQSVTFYLRSPQYIDPIRIIPVYSEKESPIVFHELPGDGLWNRRFVFTTVTATSGTHTLTAAYQQNPTGALPVHYFATAAPVTFDVAGERAVRRDRNGVLLKDEALRLARERIGLPDAPAEARLIINEAGFYDWMVKVLMPGGIERAFLVNPYLAAVRQETDPALWPQKAPPEVPRVLKQDTPQ